MNLNLKSVCAKWVPYNLADTHKTARIESCENLIQSWEDEMQEGIYMFAMKMDIPTFGAQ